MPTILAFFLTLPLSILATRAVLAWLRHKRILDHPNERSSHSQPTPRGGGLAIAPVVLASWAVLAATGVVSAAVWPVIGGAAALLALSWIDDKNGLSPRLRLSVHLGVAIIGILALPGDRLVFQGLLPLWADRTAAVIGWVWFLNLYNFMDGIDGITGVETASIGGGLVVLALMTGGTGAPLAAVLVAAALGFLVFNWHPAKIFLGDSGSVPLGYALGWLLLNAAADGHLAAALILPAYYLADATITLGRRAVRGEKVWQAHRQHFYQQALRGGRVRHDHVALLILGENILLIALAVLALHRPAVALAGTAVTVAVLLTTLARLGKETAP
ncbi:MAG TPA: glycosyltransferase family 4 protein [Patescibacteria group bacterium]|nr:glycosyltransferase family 4 protein [Patescibacteria group bacterium]